MLTFSLLILLSSCSFNSNSSRKLPYYAIPDKYNTGADEKTTFNYLHQTGTVNGVYIRKNDDFYIISGQNPKDAPSLPVEVTISDYNFEDRTFRVYNTDKVSKKTTITFNNCKFGGFRNNGPYNSNKIFFIFNNCTFSGGVNEVNITLNWCKIGGFPSDAMNPLKNFKAYNTFVYNLVPYGNDKGTHVDGFQIYGRKDAHGGNIDFENVRFEIPSIHFEGNTSAVNACVMFQLEFGNVNNCHFNNLICNGGGKWFPLYLTKGKKVNGHYFSQINLSLTNVKVSNNFGTIFYTANYDDRARVQNVEHLDKLYVSSIFKGDDSNIHIICTNDTSIDKTLKVSTDKGEFAFEIPHCPSNWALGGEIDGKVNPTEALTDKNGRPYISYRYEDMPFDLDFIIPGNCKSIICSDGDTILCTIDL